MELLQLMREDNVTTLLSKLPYVGKMIQDARSMLTIADTFPPGNSRKAIRQLFENLSEQLEKEKRELVNIIQMENLNVRYGEHIVSIQTAIRSWGNIANARDDAERSRCIRRFKEFCADQKLTTAMDNLIEGLSGEGTLQINILDRYYTVTGGNLHKVKSLARKLLQLVNGGFVAMCSYETLINDQTSAEEVLSAYTNRIEDITRNIESVFERCKNESRENMMRDLNKILDSNNSNTEAVNSLSSLMTEKYDWLENYCIVCNETFSVDCWFEGNHVCSRGRNGKFGVIFYQDVMRAAVVQEREQYIDRILEKFTRSYWIIPDAKVLCQHLVETLRSNGIETCGCAVIKPSVSFVYRSLYTIFPSLFDYENTMGFQKKGNSLNTAHYCSKGYLLGPKEIHFVIQYKQTTTVSNGTNTIVLSWIPGMQDNAGLSQNAIRLAIAWR